MQATLSPSPLSLDYLGLYPGDDTQVYTQTLPEELITQTLIREEGQLSSSGALVIHTGKFTGRSPRDRFIVKDADTAETVDWNEINRPFDARRFDGLQQQVCAYLSRQDLWVRDSYVCADPRYRLQLRVVTEQPSGSLFCYNMFGRPGAPEAKMFTPDWTVLHAPGFRADPAADGTADANFVILNFGKRVILIGGTAYTGEIKKSIFSVLNYLLPAKGVLSMHCSANRGRQGDTALFFGLSGTGKTTLSTDPHRQLIGDDEHGWSDEGVFNFEGGCYAKCIDLNIEKEPQIFRAIRHGALLENVRFFPGSREVDYADRAITENTRVSYPLYHIEDAAKPPSGSHPRHIFFLACDAYGVLPPIARLDEGQAMYQFLSGYTAKVAGTETGVTEPSATFSACFGAPFLPLHPARYAALLGERIRRHRVQCWLVNTGWTGGGYGSGTRIPLSYTRAMITAALEGRLDTMSYTRHPVFGTAMPTVCPGVPAALLDPRNTWKNPSSYDKQAGRLAGLFINNFKKYEGHAGSRIRNGAPHLFF